jgi:hypothetical protein
VDTDIPHDLDKEIWGPVKKNPEQNSNLDTSRGPHIPPRYLKRGLRSYVLLSACGEEEYARETSTGGFFTTHLLDTLEAVDADTVTYAELIHRIPCHTKWVTYFLNWRRLYSSS